MPALAMATTNASDAIALYMAPAVYAYFTPYSARNSGLPRRAGSTVLVLLRKDIVRGSGEAILGRLRHRRKRRDSRYRRLVFDKKHYRRQSYLLLAHSSNARWPSVRCLNVHCCGDRWMHLHC